eukprot:scaffold18142_cov45-Phaeocystis_antarctica.AAC.1
MRPRLQPYCGTPAAPPRHACIPTMRRLQPGPRLPATRFTYGCRSRTPSGSTPGSVASASLRRLALAACATRHTCKHSHSKHSLSKHSHSKHSHSKHSHSTCVLRDAPAPQHA